MSPILILLILILICRSRRKEEAVNRFCYDQRDWNILKMLVKITVALLAAEIVFWNWVERGDDRAEGTVALIAAALYAVILVPLTAYSWLRALDCFFYIKRLEKHGYFLPKRKTDYGNDLRNMPRMRGYTEKREIERNDAERIGLLQKEQAEIIGSGKCQEQEKEGDTAERQNWESIALAVLAWGAAAVFFFRGFFYCIAWFETYEGAGDIISKAFFSSVCNTLVWIAIGFWYYRQRSESRFRDDVEPEDGRRQRRSIIAGVTILGMLFMGAFIFQDVIFSYTSRILRQ